ncbi:hypothetical protein KC345_g8612 [Hortaea werneckii]|nr:hypothetical protein KC345_g8612 [Hortaea werneckii]
MDASDVSEANLYERRRKQQNRDAQRRFRQRNKQINSRTSSDHAEEITFSAPIPDLPNGNSPSQALATLFTNLGDAAQADISGSYVLPDAWNFDGGIAPSSETMAFLFPQETEFPDEAGFTSSSNGSKEHIVFGSGTIDWSSFEEGQGHPCSDGEHGEINGKVAESPTNGCLRGLTSFAKN